MLSARERISVYAAVADSFITSPICPVRVMTPLPGMRVASMNRISPPTGVYAIPVATPGTLVRLASSGSNFRGPSTSRDSFARDGDLVGFALDDLRRDGAGDRADLPLQVPHARLARVSLDDPAQRLVLEFHLLAPARRWLPVAAGPGSAGRCPAYRCWCSRGFRSLPSGRAAGRAPGPSCWPWR